MSFGDDLIEVFGLSGGEGSEAEVIDDQEIGSNESFNSLLPGLICPGGMKASEHLNRLDKKDIVAFTAGFMAQGLCQMAFTHACRAIDEDMLFFLDEDAGG